MTSREEFEAFALSPEGGLSAGHLVKGEDGEYLNFAAQCYWDFWQGSRAALAIDLPKPLPSGDYRMTVPFYKAADIIEALSAAGIEVKA
jgi:hypothetical protein